MFHYMLFDIYVLPYVHMWCLCSTSYFMSRSFDCLLFYLHVAPDGDAVMCAWSKQQCDYVFIVYDCCHWWVCMYAYMNRVLIFKVLLCMCWLICIARINHAIKSCLMIDVCVTKADMNNQWIVNATTTHCTSYDCYTCIALMDYHNNMHTCCFIVFISTNTPKCTTVYATCYQHHVYLWCWLT